MKKDEFMEFYRTISAQYDEDLAYVSMIKGCWGIKFEMPDPSQRIFAGGNDTAVNSRDRYQKAN